MKKIVYLLLAINTGLFAQVPLPKSTTTFSNISATGNLTVTGSAKISGAITSPTLYGSSAASGTLNLMGTSSATAGVVSAGSSTASGFISRGTSTLTGAVTTGTINNGASGLYLGAYGSTQIAMTGGGLVFSNVAGSTSGSAIAFGFTVPSHYSLTASTNIPAFKITGATRGWLTGAIANQYENYFTAPTYTAAGASTITTAAGLYVEQPIPSTNVTITNKYGIGTNGNLLLGSAGLTGGNTGTVAVLSDAVFAVNFLVGFGQNPVDATTYYLAQNGYPWQTASIGAFTAPYNLTLVGYNTSMDLSGVGSAESATLQVFQNATTATNLNTTMNYNSNFTYTVGGLSINIDANQKIEPRIITPTWVTNPTGVYQNVTFLFVRRQ